MTKIRSPSAVDADAGPVQRTLLAAFLRPDLCRRANGHCPPRRHRLAGTAGRAQGAGPQPAGREVRLFKRSFPCPTAPRTRQSTTLGAFESVLRDGCGLLGVDGAAKIVRHGRRLRVIPCHQTASIGPANLRTQSTPAALVVRVARTVMVGQRQAACSAWPRVGARGGARACNPKCVRIFSITDCSRIAAMILSSPRAVRAGLQVDLEDAHEQPRPSDAFGAGRSADARYVCRTLDTGRLGRCRQSCHFMPFVAL